MNKIPMASRKEPTKRPKPEEGKNVNDNVEFVRRLLWFDEIRHDFVTARIDRNECETVL